MGIYYGSFRNVLLHLHISGLKTYSGTYFEKVSIYHNYIAVLSASQKNNLLEIQSFLNEEVLFSTFSF